MKNRRSFIIGLSSHYLSINEKNFLKKYKPWGVILFSRNIGSINQTKKLTNEIRKIFNDNKYPILVDQEGGRVSRIEKFIDTSIFTGEYFGKIYPKASEANLYAISEAFVTGHKKKVYLASKYPNLKQVDIETLSEIVTDNEIRQYEKDSGNS